MGSIFRIGRLFVFGIKLQGYFFIKVLLGGVFLGIFPALLGLYRLIHHSLTEKELDHFHLMNEIKKFNKEEFWQINVLGYSFLFLGTILGINLTISRHYIQNGFFHLLLIIFMVLFLGSSLYLLPIFAKYHLPFKQYFYQTVLYFLVNIVETVAIFLGMIVSGIIGILIPVIGLFTGIPLLFLPYVWFSISAVKKAELALYTKEDA